MFPALRLLFYGFIFVGFVLVYVPINLIGSNEAWPVVTLGEWGVVGWGAIVIGGMVILWSAGLFALVGRGTPAPMDPPREFVVVGPYRCVRNPMYIGALTVVVGEFFFAGDTILLGYAGLLFLSFHLFVVRYEEPTLRRRFGEEYNQFLQHVPRWLPRFTPYQAMK